MQSFICEIYSIVRSHVNALGGNAVVSYFMSEFVVIHSVHKNQVKNLQNQLGGSLDENINNNIINFMNGI